MEFIKKLVIKSVHGTNKAPIDFNIFSSSISNQDIFKYWYNKEKNKQSEIEKITGYASEIQQIFSELELKKHTASFSVVENWGRGDVVTRHELSIVTHDYITSI